MSPILIGIQCDILGWFHPVAKPRCGRGLRSIESAATTASSPTSVEVAPHQNVWYRPSTRSSRPAHAMDWSASATQSSVILWASNNPKNISIAQCLRLLLVTSESVNCRFVTVSVTRILSPLTLLSYSAAIDGSDEIRFCISYTSSERQLWLASQLPSSAGNARAVRMFGTQLLSIRIDLDC